MYITPPAIAGGAPAPPGIGVEPICRPVEGSTARSVPWARAVAEDGGFKPRAELDEIYRGEAGLQDGDAIVAYCRIGERSSHT